MKKIILASNNKHKIEEIQAILTDLDFEVKSLKDEGINIEVEEDGETFEENAKKKATEIAQYLIDRGDKEFIVLADDSGLQVDYLNGAPGVYSARYAGEHGNDRKNNEKLLHELKGIDMVHRSAKFVCQLALINDKGKYLAITGEVEGKILEELSGKEGFGYDSLFFYEPLNRTFGELSSEEKNRVSHRSNALGILKQRIGEML
ncbi:MAG: XTP/dITP diphosphatase [Clostridium sp.]|nr:XTP/dITP diphosphatase [Clostridium sp.]